MALKHVKPTTSARRKMTYPDFSMITKKKPDKSLVVPLKKHAGRDAYGHLSVRHQGGGHKKMYRLIDFKQNKLDVSANVEAIEYDPNRSAYIALIKYEDGQKAYILAPTELKVDDKIIASQEGEIKPGNRLPLQSIPTGIPIYNIEMNPGKGGQIVRSAGLSASILAKEGGYAHLRLPSGEVRKVLLICYASIGSLSNPLHATVRFGNAGRRRHMGIRPTVRGKAMHPAAHPHGGGEGVNPIGMKHPKTPWGKPALGARTRRRKYTDKYIIKRRGKGR